MTQGERGDIHSDTLGRGGIFTVTHWGGFTVTQGGEDSWWYGGEDSQ